MARSAAKKGSSKPGTFQPGHKVNARENMPRGRFITRQLIAQLQEEIDDPDFDPKDKAAVRKRAKVVYFFCKKLIKMALAGDSTCIKMVMDRVEGTAISTVMFKDIPDGAETPDQMEQIRATREKLATMTEDELDQLYAETVASQSSLTEDTRTSGSA